MKIVIDDVTTKFEQNCDGIPPEIVNFVNMAHSEEFEIIPKRLRPAEKSVTVNCGSI